MRVHVPCFLPHKPSTFNSAVDSCVWCLYVNLLRIITCLGLHLCSFTFDVSACELYAMCIPRRSIYCISWRVPTSVDCIIYWWFLVDMQMRSRCGLFVCINFKTLARKQTNAQVFSIVCLMCKHYCPTKHQFDHWLSHLKSWRILSCTAQLQKREKRSGKKYDHRLSVYSKMLCCHCNNFVWRRMRLACFSSVWLNLRLQPAQSTDQMRFYH